MKENHVDLVFKPPSVCKDEIVVFREEFALKNHQTSQEWGYMLRANCLWEIAKCTAPNLLDVFGCPDCF